MEIRKEKLKAASHAAGKAFGTLLTILIVLMAVELVFSKATKTDFSLLGFRPAIVLTGSMEPTIKTGAFVIIMETNEVEEGDIAAFKQGSRLVIHRVVEIDEEGNITTKGDANEDADPVKQTAVTGKVVFKCNLAAPVSSMILKL